MNTGIIDNRLFQPLSQTVKIQRALPLLFFIKAATGCFVKEAAGKFSGSFCIIASRTV